MVGGDFHAIKHSLIDTVQASDLCVLVFVHHRPIELGVDGPSVATRGQVHFVAEVRRIHIQLLGHASCKVQDNSERV